MFSSTGSVYGETKEIPTKENSQFFQYKLHYMVHQKFLQRQLFQHIVKVMILNVLFIDLYLF